MIRFQFDGQEPQTVETPQEIVGLIQKYTRIGALYALRVIDDAEGHIILVSEALSNGGKDTTTDDLPANV